MRVCLITGANAGIGKAACVQMLQNGYRVVMACRDKQRGQKALEEAVRQSGSDAAELLMVDMSLQSSIREAAAKYKEMHDTLDVLISNAAAFDITQKKPIKTAEGIESIWATNHLGPVLLVEELMAPLKRAQGRVITVASQGLAIHPMLKVDLADPEFEKSQFSVSKAYYQSKLAQVMVTYWLADQLKGTGVTANCVRVTSVQIDISRYPGLSKAAKLAYAVKSKKSIPPEQMAQVYVWLATAPELKEATGGYYDHHFKKVESSRYSKDPQAIAQLMKLTYTYLGKQSI